MLLAAALLAPATRSVFAAERSSDGALTAMVINKTSGALTGAINIANFAPGASADVYRYSAANLAAIAQPSDVAVGGSFNMSFPAASITLLVIPAA